LQEKPLLAQEAYLAAIASHVQTVEESGDALVVFPLFTERDFLYPVLFQKFHAAFFAGWSWQRATASDMLGDPVGPGGYDGAALRDVLCVLLFPALFALPSTASVAVASSLSQALRQSASLLVASVLLQRWDRLYQTTLLLLPPLSAESGQPIPPMT
jgi:hypothetical protein